MSKFEILHKCVRHKTTDLKFCIRFVRGWSTKRRIFCAVFWICSIIVISIKTLNSAEDIFLSQKKVIAEIIHGFCHDLRTVTIQYGYPQDVIGKLPDQRQIVL